MLQFQYEAPWVSTFDQLINSELKHNNSLPFITFQFSTIDVKSGYPKNRTVVFRGWLFNNKSSNVIIFTTDKRMEKYSELKLNDKFEACFWLGCCKKQFRFRGKARILDEENKPKIDISNIEKGHIINDADSINTINTINTITINEEQTKNDDPPEINLNNKETSVQSIPIHSSLLSPKFVENEANSTSLPSKYLTPSHEEYDAEVKRQWNQLSKNMKNSFKKPPSKSIMTDETQKTISSIKRGVDGKKDDYGFKNFALIGLFIDYVDLYDLDKDKRFIYEMNENQQWIENEVCP
ncbi:unnamed protein product [Candida verbasci]|uniref:Pyridoxamine 5'-phosphate oxidase Alr4036 family FMN-binding domain-containing protein n=1 Tax=Candida verbasci TaxID=1227364 RepID=A0A9W4U2U6_9ASCO|nr:unnamed protein product [Candida verbasci]